MDPVGAVWATGVLPASWTDTRITLLYKKGDSGDASNYRPIVVPDTVQVDSPSPEKSTD